MKEWRRTMGGWTSDRVVWHAPLPGPFYWEWRCLRCGHPVGEHATLRHRVARRLLIWRRFR